MKTKTKLSMTPAKTSQETLNISSAYESTNVLVCVQILSRWQSSAENPPPTISSSRKGLDKWIDFWTSDSSPPP